METSEQLTFSLFGPSWKLKSFPAVFPTYININIINSIPGYRVLTHHFHNQ